MDEVDARQAAAYLLKLQSATKSFLAFVNLMEPDFVLQPFQKELIATLDLLEKRKLRNDKGELVYKLLVTMPPRVGKSTFVTELFSVYCMCKEPELEIMSAAYNDELARTFGNKVRARVTDSVIKQAFPKLGLSNASSSATHWRTQTGGAYYGVGLDGTTTGRGAGLLLVDDPYRSRAEADSPTIREKVWNIYTTSLRTRKQNSKSGKKPIEVVVHTRWHPDDLAGRIQATPEWKRGEWIHLNYQAIVERPVDVKVRADALPEEDPRYMPYKIMREVRLFRRRRSSGANIGREEVPLSNEAIPHRDKQLWVPKDFDEVSLWEERMPLEELRKMREIDRRGFDALYQQSPTIIGGNMIKPHWFGYYNDKPVKFLSIVMAADTAFKAKTKNDYSVMMIGGLADNGDIYVLDLLREKLEFPELKRQMLFFAGRYKAMGLRGIYIEDKASGQSLIQELRTTAPAPVIPFRLAGGSDKVSRVASITPYMASGKVLLPKAAPWLDNFLVELGQFPNGAHDDQVDTLYILVDTLSRIPIATQEILTAPIGTLFGNDTLGGPFTTELRSNSAGWMGNWKTGKMIGWGE